MALGMRFAAGSGMDILTGGKRRRRPWQVTGLSAAGDTAGDVGIAPRAVLRGDAHVDDVALDQHRGVHDVLIGTEDGEEGAVGRCHIDLAVERV